LFDVVENSPAVAPVRPVTVDAKPVTIGEDVQETVMLAPLTAVPFVKYVWICVTHQVFLPFALVWLLTAIVGLIVGRGRGLGDGLCSKQQVQTCWRMVEVDITRMLLQAR
jgi:hypothetical protein